MEIMTRPAVWLAERSMEIVIITAVMMIAERRSMGVGGGGSIEEFLRTTGLGLLFYLLSGSLYLACISD